MRCPTGLAAYVLSNSDPLLARLVRDIDAGAIGINNFGASLPEAPFGGVKSSGYGSEGGYEGLDPYLVTKYVNHALMPDQVPDEALFCREGMDFLASRIPV